MKNKEDIRFLIVDLFCGFGGTTTGFLDAEINGQKICKVIACINHDKNAIKSHWLNHPDVKHFEEDIRTLDLTELIKICTYWKSIYPDAYLILWGSLECTNHSKAKGGLSRDADSRTLADFMERYILAIQPEYIMIENVVEFKIWGPLKIKELSVSGYSCCPLELKRDKKTKKSFLSPVWIPDRSKLCQDFNRWNKEICLLGYHSEWKELNSANFGAYTSRNRLFGCFALNGLPIVFPEPTHAKKSKKQTATLFDKQLKQWMPVRDVLDLQEEGEDIFDRKKPLARATLERIYEGLIKFTPDRNSNFISNYKSGDPKYKNFSIENPIGTITTVPTQSIIKMTFLDNYYGKGYATSIDAPSGTIRTKDSMSLISSNHFINRDMKTSNSSIDAPAGSLTTVPKMSLVTLKNSNYYLLNPQFKNKGTSIDKPCFTLIARMDKMPPYLIEIEKGSIGIIIKESDCQVTIKIKHFMAEHGIMSIRRRMLKIKELLKIQGFNPDYKIQGTQTEAKKFIGNSVHPLVPKYWAISLFNATNKVLC